MIQKPKIILFFLVVVVLSTSLFSGCTMKQKLMDGEYFVDSPKIDFDGKARDVDDKNKLLYELSTIVTQKPNSRWFWHSRVPLWIHFKNTQGEWKFFEKLSQEISIYDEDERINTERLMTNYLKRQGFFDAKVTSKVKFKKYSKIAKVKYKIFPGRKYYVGKFHYETRDSSIIDLIPELEANSIFKLGAPVSEENYYIERKRAAQFLQDKGFAYFADDYITEIEVDTTDKLQYLDVRIKILSPSEKGNHETFTIRNINVYPDFRIGNDEYQKDTIIDGIHFYFDDLNFVVAPEKLITKIYFRPGEIYNQSLLTKTRNSLTQYEFYKFSTLKINRIDDVQNMVDVDIVLTKGLKRSIGGGVNLKYGYGGNNGLLATEGTSFFALGFNVGLENKNVFGGGEVFRLRPRLQLEFNQKANKMSVFDVGLSSDILTHKFIEIFRLFRLFSKNKPIYKSFKDDGVTSISMILNSQRILYAYRNQSIETKISYDLLRNRRERIVLNQVGIDYLQKDRVDSVYKERVLDRNPFLAKSLENQLFTGIFYKSLNYFRKSKSNEKIGFSWSYYLNHDISGLEVLAINKLLGLANRELPAKKFKFSKFTKLDLDLRGIYKFTPKSALAFRLFAGAAVPFGNSDVVPYVKQYYVGGYNSIRGWAIRQLGPGAYRDTSEVLTPFQKGDLRLESNLEYRFSVYKYIRGAFFVDAGNIWTLKEDPSRPKAKFESDFYNQIAISTGFGMRFDFGLALIRVDIGHKTKSPYLLESGKYWQGGFNKLFKRKDWNDYWNFNIGLDYPF